MKKPAIFLDRDNTLIANDGDLGDPSAVKMIQGAASAVASLRGLGYRLIVITNQGGVARGKYSEKDVDAVHRRVNELIRQNTGAFIDRFYFCPYHPQATVSKYKQDHPWRKPNPGMLLQAAKDENIDLSQSWTIGDQMRDIEAGLKAGTRTVLIDPKAPAISEMPPLTAGRMAQAHQRDRPAQARPHFVARSLVEAVRIVAQQRKPESSEEIRRSRLGNARPAVVTRGQAASNMVQQAQGNASGDATNRDAQGFQTSETAAWRTQNASSPARPRTSAPPADAKSTTSPAPPSPAPSQRSQAAHAPAASKGSKAIPSRAASQSAQAAPASTASGGSSVTPATGPSAEARRAQDASGPAQTSQSAPGRAVGGPIAKDQLTPQDEPPGQVDAGSRRIVRFDERIDDSPRTSLSDLPEEGSDDSLDAAASADDATWAPPQGQTHRTPDGKTAGPTAQSPTAAASTKPPGSLKSPGSSGSSGAPTSPAPPASPGSSASSIPAGARQSQRIAEEDDYLALPGDAADPADSMTEVDDDQAVISAESEPTPNSPQARSSSSPTAASGASASLSARPGSVRQAPAQVEPTAAESGGTPGRSHGYHPGLEPLLRQILQELRNQQATRGDFSMTSLVAMVVQIVALAILAGALWLGTSDPQWFAPLMGTAMFVQMMVIAVLLWSRQ